MTNMTKEIKGNVENLGRKLVAIEKLNQNTKYISL